VIKSVHRRSQLSGAIPHFLWVTPGMCILTLYLQRQHWLLLVTY
jgi:hypothetical protein